VSRTARRWAAELTQARVPAGVVNDIGAAFALAESLGMSPIVSVPDGDGPPVRLPRNPIGLSRTPPTYRSAPPDMPGESD
jgi:crotonobetainyl-CoA:carnitine CoA-transferase CaiB-like acyl-CoA transferase